MTPKAIQGHLDDYVSITEYAYLVHDKDQDSQGAPVGAHIQGVVRLKHAREQEQLAQWLRLPSALVKPIMGRGPGKYARVLRYLTHESPSEQAQGKHHYSDSEVVANFDWRAAIDAHFTPSVEQPLTALQQVKMDLLSGRTTANQVRDQHPLIYAEHSFKLRRLETDFLERVKDLAVRLDYWTEAGTADLQRIYGLKTAAEELGIQGSLEEQCLRAVRIKTSPFPGGVV
ncbi:hypothetical protein GCM10009672_18250 [Nesterenkonia lutea]